MHDEVFTSTFWIRIVLALVCGATIGIERQLRGKPAGIRTSILICLGTMAFVQIGTHLGDGGAGDATRVVGQVVTGVGFLGAGVMLTRDGLVIGVTSAATIWLLAAVGCAIGVDHYAFAVALTVTALLVLLGVQGLERLFRALTRGMYAPDFGHDGEDPRMRDRMSGPPRSVE